MILAAVAVVIGVVVPAYAMTRGGTEHPAAAAAASAVPAADAQPGTGAVVLIGTGGLTWNDVSKKTTPNLWTLLRDGSSAAMSIRSVYTNACPIDGWLGVSSGGRAAADRTGLSANPQDRPCPGVPPVGADGVVPNWTQYVAAANATRFDSRLGLLGDTAAANNVCIKAIGPGAGVAAARSDGTVARYSVFDPATLLTDIAGCPIAIVDVGSLRDPADVVEGETTTGTRAQQVAAIDARIGQVIDAAPNGADFIVASLSDAGRSERLRLVVARGPDYGPGELYSPSTRQPGLVQAQDLTVTVLSRVRIPLPPGLGGATLESGTAPDNSDERASARLKALVDYDEASHAVHALVPPFFMAFAYGQLLIYLYVLLVWKGRIGSPGKRITALVWVRRVAVSAASVPASTFLANLIPWWRFPIPMVSVVLSVALFVLLITGTALSGPWSRSPVGPLIVVSGVTMSVLAVDVMTGSRLQLSSLMGLQPVVAGRFYGMGNVTFALFATSALLLATGLASLVVRQSRTRAAAIVIIIGAAAVLVDGAPFWGADGGGPPALVPGLAYFVLTILGIAMTWKRGLLIAVGSALLFLAVGFADWLRPPDSRTHLGAFIQAMIDGNASDIVIRKAQQNLEILRGNMPLTLLVPAALIFVFYVLARPTSWGSRSLQRSIEVVPTLRAGLIAVLVMVTIGFAINDSGVAIPAVAATVGVPLIVSVAVRTLEDEVRANAPTRATRRRR